MTHPDPQVRLEGEMQMGLVDAWELLGEVLEKSQNPEFGRSHERQEWVLKVEALRGCVLLAAARLIDVHHVEQLPLRGPVDRRKYTGHAFAKRRARTNGESAVVKLAEEVGNASRRFELLCPFGFPAMTFGLGRLAKWIKSGELQLASFFGVGSTPGRERARAMMESAGKGQRLRNDLAKQDALIEASGRAMRERAGV